ncbi:chitinase 1 [Magnaporthiopsis poae ATCC 64411]|uniref:chitinase n=1 Tax=Magnaporthiopsis poae (strain ATCC 64411 / 73-15) TaxID=644358 RepID=A0A0C4E5B3_MAGP6|nr:chitinase 1 [Magnaporthiopsis poae ATCC 64411]
MAYRILALLICGVVACLASIMSIMAHPQPSRCIMYLTGQHNVVPNIGQLGHVTHVALAFMNSAVFNDDARLDWPMFTTVDAARRQFVPGTKIMVAIGGWGDTEGFVTAARSEESRRRFAANVARMVTATGADGVDVDWEYPGGNGDDYKRVPNSERAWEVDAYPLLVAEIRLMSAAVPGLERDMMAFTRETVPRILRHLDFLNVMTYDLMNRRDNVTRHHTGLQLSLESIDAYVARGALPSKLNLGFAFYVKYFQTEHDSCRDAKTPVGCPTLLLEDPKTGADLGRAGAFSWHDPVPSAVSSSFENALANGTYDESGGGYYYWDAKQDLWWTFDTADAIKSKLPAIVGRRNLGGVFAWGLGEDAPEFKHLQAVSDGLENLLLVKESSARREL